MKKIDWNNDILNEIQNTLLKNLKQEFDENSKNSEIPENIVDLLIEYNPMRIIDWDKINLSLDYYDILYYYYIDLMKENNKMWLEKISLSTIFAYGFRYYLRQLLNQTREKLLNVKKDKEIEIEYKVINKEEKKKKYNPYDYI